eukprot:gnl/TRDRNA2_/TRDRNA2_174349_c0_seq2.p1 gnl/TRDRNA2_/TRDRNA2_174349_c0~~gnl/TRDRNA2_/TRDRNA2_174349_c0_seq2.p1  ORF type:complete len:1071 (+),score=112.82 gnl/TRDRNA2_/TRDRNA2_174349_c0_seq2:2-3214(+)
MVHGHKHRSEIPEKASEKLTLDTSNPWNLGTSASPQGLRTWLDSSNANFLLKKKAGTTLCAAASAGVPQQCLTDPTIGGGQRLWSKMVFLPRCDIETHFDCDEYTVKTAADFVKGFTNYLEWYDKFDSQVAGQTYSQSQANTGKDAFVAAFMDAYTNSQIDASCACPANQRCSSVNTQGTPDIGPVVKYQYLEDGEGFAADNIMLSLPLKQISTTGASPTPVPTSNPPSMNKLPTAPPYIDWRDMALSMLEKGKCRAADNGVLDARDNIMFAPETILKLFSGTASDALTCSASECLVDSSANSCGSGSDCGYDKVKFTQTCTDGSGGSESCSAASSPISMAGVDGWADLFAHFMIWADQQMNTRSLPMVLDQMRLPHVLRRAAKDSNVHASCKCAAGTFCSNVGIRGQGNWLIAKAQHLHSSISPPSWLRVNNAAANAAALNVAGLATLSLTGLNWDAASKASIKKGTCGATSGSGSAGSDSSQAPAPSPSWWDSCVTNDPATGQGQHNVGAGKKCSFPFTFQHVVYNSCTSRAWPHAWCSTNVNSVSWGNCGSNCRVAEQQCVTAASPPAPAAASTTTAIGSPPPTTTTAAANFFEESQAQAPAATTTAAPAAAAGQQCAIPFTYNGVQYYSCLKQNDADYFWCPLSKTYSDGDPWGYCGQDCPVQQVSTSMLGNCVTRGNLGAGAGKTCNFPFTYKGRQYNACAGLDWPEPWCPTTPAPFDFVKNWAVCDTTNCPITPPTEEKAKGFCFPGHAKVISRSGPKDMADLHLGDEILGFNSATGKNEFTKVRAWLHRVTQGEVAFTKLHTTAGDVVMSPGHNVAVGSPHVYSFAHDISAGDALITPNHTARVTRVSSEVGTGLYAPWTMTSNFYVGMGEGYFLAHGLANVHSRFETLVNAMFTILELFMPSIHKLNEGTDANYLHPIARVFWSIIDVPTEMHSFKTADNEIRHPIKKLVASVAGSHALWLSEFWSSAMRASLPGGYFDENRSTPRYDLVGRAFFCSFLKHVRSKNKIETRLSNEPIKKRRWARTNIFDWFIGLERQSLSQAERHRTRRLTNVSARSYVTGR